MPRPTRFFRLLAVVLAALLAGCAHTRALPPEGYRSPEGFGEAKWGMTPADLSARLDGAELLDPHTYRTREQVDGRNAQVTYAFPSGRLSAVTVQYEIADFDGNYDLLSHRYGKPLPPPGARAEENAALTVAAVVAAVLVIGIIIAIATHGHGGGGHASGPAVHGAAAIAASVPPAGIVHPVRDACWLDFAALQMADASLHVAVAASAAADAPPPPPPPGGWMAEWRTDETDVVLLGVELGTPRASVAVSYRSVALNPPPAD